MKKCILLFLAVATLSSCATQSNFHSFYKENKREATFTISTPSFFANLFIPKEDTREYEALFKGVKHYKVMIYDTKKDALDRKFDRFISRKRYHTVFKLKENGEKIQFYFLKRGDVIKEMVLKIKGDDSYVILGLKTNIHQQDFNSIITNSNESVVVN